MIGICRKHHKCNTKIGKERYSVTFRDNFIKSFETTTHTHKKNNSHLTKIAFWNKSRIKKKISIFVMRCLWDRMSYSRYGLLFFEQTKRNIHREEEREREGRGSSDKKTNASLRLSIKKTEWKLVVHTWDAMGCCWCWKWFMA